MHIITVLRIHWTICIQVSRPCSRTSSQLFIRDDSQTVVCSSRTYTMRTMASCMYHTQQKLNLHIGSANSICFSIITCTYIRNPHKRFEFRVRVPARTNIICAFPMYASYCRSTSTKPRHRSVGDSSHFQLGHRLRFMVQQFHFRRRA